jgi:phosphoadenosine phosphosulfate reductase
MSLIENGLFGKIDKVAIALERINMFVPRDGSGYYLAFSGGKDSIVVKDLMIRSCVKFDAHQNITTVDAPELLRYVRKYHPDVILERPKTSMFKLIVKKMMPPTRLVRYCCAELKEKGGDGRVVVTGVRWAESNKRKLRQLYEVCKKSSTKHYLHPIIDWSDEEVWEYIRSNKLPYCSIYDEGFKRIGCIGCPMAGKSRIKEFERWPKFRAAYGKAFAAAVANLAALGPEFGGRGRTAKLRWENGEDMFRWWMDEDTGPEEDDGQCYLFSASEEDNE